MTGLWRNRKMLALTLAAVALACAVALLSIEWVSPQPVAHVLGSDWQCSRIAFITTCSRVHKTTPLVHGLCKDLVCFGGCDGIRRPRRVPQYFCTKVFRLTV